VVKIAYQRAGIDRAIVRGNIPILDVQYGNVWSNIPDSLIRQAGHNYGDSVLIEIRRQDSVIYTGRIPLAHTFGEVKEGESLAYFNSLMNFSLAINKGDFAKTFRVGSGAEWSITVR
jgi:S-adenosylmethionine hydrolase